MPFRVVTGAMRVAQEEDRDDGLHRLDGRVEHCARVLCTSLHREKHRLKGAWFFWFRRVHTGYTGAPHPMGERQSSPTSPRASSSTSTLATQEGWPPRLSPATCRPWRCAHTIDTTRKATVAYPTVKRLLIHMFYATHPQKLMKSHEMV